MKTFEYKRILNNGYLLVSEINKMGQDGWELMKEEFFKGWTKKDCKCYYLFKREINK